jgi:transposase
VSHDDVLFGYRLQLFDLAGRVGSRRPALCSGSKPAIVEERIVAFAIAHPGLRPKRIASELRREKWGGIVVSHNSVRRVLRRHGLNTRARRLARRRLPGAVRAAARGPRGGLAPDSAQVKRPPPSRND